MTSPAYITLRDVPSPTTKALKSEAKRRGVSMNQLIKDLLAQALQLSASAPFDNGLGKYGGTWTEAELKAFEKNTAQFEIIDQEVWK